MLLLLLESAGTCGKEKAGPPRPALLPPRPTAILWLRPWPPRPPRAEGCSPELAPPGLASRLELPPAEGRGNWKPEVFLFDSASSAAFLASESANECLLVCPEPAAPPPRPRGLMFSRPWLPCWPKSPKPDAPDEGAGGGPIPTLGRADWLRRWAEGWAGACMGTPRCCWPICWGNW